MSKVKETKVRRLLRESQELSKEIRDEMVGSPIDRDRLELLTREAELKMKQLHKEIRDGWT